MRSRHFLALAIALAAITGCREESPIVSGQAVHGGLFLGQYTFKEPGKQPRIETLSVDQIEILNAWLKDHSTGWGRILATPPPPSFTIAATHANGQKSRIDFFSKDPWRQAARQPDKKPISNWNHAVVFWAHDDFRMASFPVEDVEKLRRSLGDTPD